MSEEGFEVKWTVSEFLAAVNQTLEYAYSSVIVEGEVSGFKVNQGKWVFFDLKDEESSVSCFMPLFKLRMPIEDGMKLSIRAVPKVTKWGRFSLTVQQMTPVGEGSLKRSFELLKKKLALEGLFDEGKKRGIPDKIGKIGVISSTQAAGYADFCKILNARWGGIEVLTAHTQVQGVDAPDQIIRALKYFNEQAEVDIIAIIRGGGSADDLAAFNDEQLVRVVAASRIPVITGIGHEVDESLVDLAADIQASTPSNVAEMLVPDRKAEIKRVQDEVGILNTKIVQEIDVQKEAVRARITDTGRMLRLKIEGVELKEKVLGISRAIRAKIENTEALVNAKMKILEGLNPEQVLKRGYAIISGTLEAGNEVKVITIDKQADAIIKSIKERK